MTNEITYKATRKNPEFVTELIKGMKDLPDIVIGFPKGEASEICYPAEEGGESVINVAFWNNYGTRNPDGSVHIPERRFMDVGGRRATIELAPKLRKLIHDIQTGKIDEKKIFEEIGEKAAGILRKVIDEWTTPPNAPFTISKKGDDNPLVDTGLMKKTVTYDIRYGDKKEKK